MLVLIALSALMLAADTPKPTFKSVAVLPLKTKGRADKRVVEVLDDLLASAVQSVVGRDGRVVTHTDIDTMLGFQKSKDLIGCTDSSCAAEIAGALGVDAVVSGAVGVLGKKHTLSLTIIDQKHARVVARQSEDIGDKEEAFGNGVERATRRLFGIEGATATATATTALTIKLGAPKNETPQGGSAGGHPYELTCAPGSAVVGLRGAGRTPLFGFGAECGKLEVVNADGQARVRGVRSLPTTDVGGDVNPAPERYTQLCAGDAVATGIRIGIYQMDYWKIDIVGRVEIICSTLVAQKDAGKLELDTSYAGSIVAGVGAKRTLESICPDGSLLVGMHGSAGAGINSIGARCAPILAGD